MQQAHLSKITHKGDIRIKVALPYESEAIRIIKSIEGRKWSQSLQCWHLPYTKAAFAALQQHFEVHFPNQEQVPIINGAKNKSPVIATKPLTTEERLPTPPVVDSIKVLQEHDFRVKVFVPWQQKAWIQKIKSLPNRAWNIAHKYWSVPKTKTTLLQLQQLFGEALQIDPTIKWQEDETNFVPPSSPIKQKESPNDQKDTVFLSSELEDENKEGIAIVSVDTKKHFRTFQKDGRTIKAFVGQKILVEKEKEQWLKAWVPYDKKGWIEVMKDIPGRHWDVEERYWRIPYVKDSLKRLWNIIGQQYIELSFEVDDRIPTEFVIKKRSNKRAPRFQISDVQQKAITAFEEKLMLENKAWRTRKTYKSLFTHFLAYYPKTKPSSISKEQIEKYIILKKQDNISDSQLNQLINCLNCFFIRILNQEEKIVQLERPKKKRKLPNIYATEEVQLLLKAPTNLKHKCMLLLIYSGGLRRSELLNLKVEDLNFYRKTIFVRDGKGGKDRYTLFSDIAQKYIKDYFAQYTPTYYVFEGQHGGRYSESSLQKIFDTARKKAKVPSNVTIHGLRHSFTSHIMEKGVPLKAIQELLGHASIKTTEIYLHLSNKYRKELSSPLDDLDI